MTEVRPKPSLTWVLFGDLHMTQGGEQNHRDFLALIDEVNTHLSGHVDFCLLPGDNANNGEVAQYLLTTDGDRLLQLLKENRVVAVDMGHTHYNELTNDGQIIFATTRSTGQIEEGPVGFSVMNLEGDGASWRFKPLDSAWPFVMITSPVEERLVTDSRQRDQVGGDT
jgi:hypothetical protein